MTSQTSEDPDAMATTDTRPGFRLPWSSDRTDADGSDAPTADAPDAPADGDSQVADAVSAEAATTAADATPGDAVEAQAADPIPGAPISPDATSEAMPPDVPTDALATTSGEAPTDTRSTAVPIATATPAPAPAKSKPNKFLADLTRAMRGTAEAARGETMERFAADAKAAAERVQTAAADEATELRRVADEDVAGIRDWSKQEIARIREETERRISGRKADLERELELHAGTIGLRLDRVNAYVASFESEIAAFYERLFAEEDPTRFAAMAEQLPEAPSLDLPELDSAVMIGAAESPAATVQPGAETPPAAVGSADTATDATIAPDAEVPEPAALEADAAGGAELVATADAATDATGEMGQAESIAEDDPRIAALGLSPDFAAAEAEAEAEADVERSAVGDADEIPTIADEVLAARLAGLVPDENHPGTTPLDTTKVAVSGLVSVASIAGFKRHVGRLQGVTSVGVSSGPDGEFVFSVHHLPSVDLAAGVTGLPGFNAKVTGTSDGEIAVTARDPEAHD